MLQARGTECPLMNQTDTNLTGTTVTHGAHGVLAHTHIKDA
jgi:hypothetical protein